MSFLDIDNLIKSKYKSYHDNLIDDFYKIILSESVQYDRITGFFSSTSLAAVASGLINFIDNNGHMRLLCGSTLNDEDVKAVLDSNNLKDYIKLIDKKFISDIENIEDEIVENHVKILGWMVANDLLEIRIGIKKDKTDLSSSGMLHQKIGILYDNENNIISFDGSVNETMNGWTNNIESLKVFKSWKNFEFMEEDISDFEKYWNNLDSNLEIFEIPEASKLKLIKKAPKTRNELDKLITSNHNSDKRELFEHQKRAIEFWMENNNQALFEMATGTGKTFTSLKSLEEILNKENCLSVIACPQSHITLQWLNDAEKLKIGKCHKLFSSANPNWFKDFKILVKRINLGIAFEKPNIIFTTHATFSNEKFVNLIKKANIKKCLIVDEVHHVGSINLRKGLLSEYTYRLGLSATPSRYMDDEETNLLLDYFNNNIFKFSIADALSEINPITNETFLTPYNYYPFNVNFNFEEKKEYIDLTHKIAYNIGSDNKKESLDNLIRKRRRLINNLDNKYDIFKNILNQIDKKDHLIVFCSPQQIKKVLKEYDFYPRHRLTKDENSRPSKKYNGLSEREMILKLFDEGDYKALIAIKCLDEGVDVPSADKVIILSSSTNPVEYIQRRGRVLRRYKNKNIADIYDLTIIPPDDKELFNSLIKNELNRLYDFISTATNKYDCIKKLETWGVFE